MKDFVSGVRVIAVRKCYALEVSGAVEAGEGGVNYGVGAHGESDFAELAHSGDHVSENPVQIGCADRRTQGTAGLAVEFLHFSQQERVGGEDMDVRSRQKD